MKNFELSAEDRDERVRNLMHSKEVSDWLLGVAPLFRHDDLPLPDTLYDADGNVTVPDLIHFEEEEYE